VPGLGILQGSVRALRTTERRPQMQWNLVRPAAGASSRLLGDAASRWYYFVHSYVPVPEGEKASRASWGRVTTEARSRSRSNAADMFGTQFHPEKSASAACSCSSASHDLHRGSFGGVTLELWPAIDIRAGKCVRLLRGQFSSETVYGDPLEQAVAFVSAGASRLHVVDLDAAREGGWPNRHVLLRIASSSGVPVQAGGEFGRGRRRGSVRRRCRTGRGRTVAIEPNRRSWPG